MYYRVIYESLNGDFRDSLSEKLKPIQDLQPIFTSRKKALSAYWSAVREIDTGGCASLHKQIEGNANLIKRHRGYILDFLWISFYEVLNDLSFAVMLKVSYDKKYLQ